MARFLEILKIFRKTLLDADLSILAASLSYATVFSLIPILSIFLMFSQWVGEYQGLVEVAKSVILSFVTVGIKEDVVQNLQGNLININPRALGIAGLLGFFFSAIKIMYDFDKCLLKIWNVRKKHLFAKHLFHYVAILICIPLGLIALAALLEATYLSRFFTQHSFWVDFIVIGFLTTLFKFTPPAKVPWKVATLSAVVTFLFLVIAQILYIKAIKNLFLYNVYYGPIAAIPIFLLWIYCIWILILFGLTMIKSVVSSKGIIPTLKA